LVYEPLLQFNTAKPLSAPYKWLASAFTWGASGKSIVFTIRTGVKWSNGTPLTASDVAFTYNLLMKYPDINVYGLPLTGAVVSGNQVTVKFSTSEYANLQDVASVYIVPQSIWSNVGNPEAFSDPSPIGSGPYTLGTFVAGGFTLNANSTYWGGSPHVSEVDFPAIVTPSAMLTDLNTNQLDWAGLVLPGLTKSFTTSGQDHHVWFEGVSTVALYPNLQTFPTNQLAVRQAISRAIDRTTISTEGESGFEPPATSASGLALPYFAGLLTLPKSSSDLDGTSNVAAARAKLVAAGWVMGKKGFFQNAAGKMLSLEVEEPEGYTDYDTDGSLIAQELQSAGIDATFEDVDIETWSSDIGDGNFNVTVHWGYPDVSAYQTYNYWLNSSLSTGANANAAIGDYERLDSKTIDAALAKLATALTSAQQKTALTPIESYVAKELPVIPTTLGSAIDEYNSGEFTGWPSATDEYESGSPTSPTNEVVVLHLSPTS
jgi:peptide/nickel transport system substrate-binding protein